MKTKLVFFLVILFSMNSPAQTVIPALEWYSLRGTQAFFMKAVTKTDSYSNVYTAGATLNNSGDYDLLVTKYNNSGHLLWSHQYDAGVGGNDGASAIFIDSHCRVFVTGATFTASDSSDVLTIMYDSSGTQQWVSVYSGTYHRNDGGTSIILSNDSIYVGGVCTDTLNEADFLVLKYDLSGSLQWSNVYDDVHLNDISNSIAMAHSDTLAIAGAAQKSATTWAYLTVTFNASTGALINHTNSGSGAVGFDNINAMTKDNSGNIYITGAALSGGLTDFDIHTIKLNKSLSVLWSQSYNSSGTMNDVGNDIVVDGSGNVFVTGYSTTSSQGTDYVTIKYDSSGTQQWAETFNGSANGSDTAKAIIIDPHGNIAITGSSSNGSNEDYQTIKYDGSSGAVKWQISYNNKFNMNDRAFDISTDANGNIFVAGQSQDTSGKYSYNTIKYSEVTVTIPPDSEGVSGVIGYIENRDQLLGSDNNLVERVRFYTKQTSPALYFMDDTLSYVFAKIDTSNSANDSLARVDMWMSGSGTKLVPMDKGDSYTNYFLGHIPEGRANVPEYKQLYEKDVWSEIDILYSSNNRGLKYDFIVNSGANPNDIMMNFGGYDSLYSQNDSLFITTALGTIIYPQAEAFEIDGSGDTVQVGWQPQYKVTMNQVVFDNIGAYNISNKLCFKMKWDNSSTITSSTYNINWATFYPGPHTTFNDIRTDTTGFIYVTGINFDQLFAFTPGAFQTVSANQDGIVLKFYPSGARDWATYIGGSIDGDGNIGEEFSESIDVNSKGDIYITGHTTSVNYPTQSSIYPGAFFRTANCTSICFIGFISKLDSIGQHLKWSTYLQTTTGAIGKDLRVNELDYLYVVGSVADTVNFPLVNQSLSWNSSDGEGFIAKFNPHDSLVWCPRIGTEVNSVDVDDHEEVFITGNDWNCGSCVPIVNPAGNSTYGGGTSDAFITAFSLANDIWFSTLFGGAGRDEGRSVAAYKKSFAIDQSIAVVGYTTHVSDFNSAGLLHNPGGIAFFDSTCGGTTDAFLVVINLFTDSILLSTYIGGTDDEDVKNVTIDSDNNIYVVGNTQSSDFPFPPANPLIAYVDVTGSGFLMMLQNQTFYPLWTTYLDGDAFGNCNAVASSHDTLYVVGGTDCSPASFPLNDGGGIPYYYDAQSGPFIVRFATSAITGIKENHLRPESSLLVYPNPALSNINILLSVAEKSNVKISLINILGEQLMTDETREFQGDFRKSFSMDDFPDGIYLMSATLNGKYVGNMRFVKQ